MYLLLKQKSPPNLGAVQKFLDRPYAGIIQIRFSGSVEKSTLSARLDSSSPGVIQFCSDSLARFSAMSSAVDLS